MTYCTEVRLTVALNTVEVLENENRGLKIRVKSGLSTIDSIMKTYREIFRMFEEGKLKVKQSQSELTNAIVRNGEYLARLARAKDAEVSLIEETRLMVRENEGLKVIILKSSERNIEYLRKLVQFEDENNRLRDRIDEIEPEKADVDYDTSRDDDILYSLTAAEDEN